MTSQTHHRIRRYAKIGPAVLRALGMGAAATDSEYFDAMRNLAFKSDDPHEFAFWYLRSECTSKYVGVMAGGLSNDGRKAAAIESFMNGELSCAVSNSALVDPFTRVSLNQTVWRRARALCHEILGRWNYEEFISLCGFGPGASTGLRRKDSSQQKKWEKAAHITASALPYLLAFHKWAAIDRSGELEREIGHKVDIPSRVTVVPGNRVTTVPKSWKTDRVIAIEPDWNMFFQKGVGACIRKRLQRYGLLRKDAQNVNRRAAKHGALTGLLATLDLKSASDSVSLALCEALLPDEWLQHVLSLRSPVGVVEGISNPVVYEKVSSMGNGFTFELETLLFYCLAVSACGKRAGVRVYGDDLIVPARYADRVVTTFREAGFSVNTTKSFSSGPFRESCGGHYFGFKDVTPFYLRHDVESISDAIVLHNHVLSWHSTQGYHPSPEWLEVIQRCRQVVPKKLWGPWRLPGCLWANWDECTPKWLKDEQCYRQETISRVHLYEDLVSSCGSFLFKLWVVDSDLRSSYLARSTSKEKWSKVTVDRTAWEIVPVRTA